MHLFYNYNVPITTILRLRHLSNTNDTYLTKDKVWSKNRADAELMSEEQASDTCGDYSTDCGCGSMTVIEASESIKLIARS